MQQAACQCRATSGNSFNCIVYGMLREDRAAWTSRDSRGSGGPIPPGWWFSARGLAIMIWPSESGDQESGNPALFAIHDPKRPILNLYNACSRQLRFTKLECACTWQEWHSLYWGSVEVLVSTLLAEGLLVLPVSIQT